MIILNDCVTIVWDLNRGRWVETVQDDQQQTVASLAVLCRLLFTVHYMNQLGINIAWQEIEENIFWPLELHKIPTQILQQGGEVYNDPHLPNLENEEH